jgi:hypothetical protein
MNQLWGKATYLKNHEEILNRIQVLYDKENISVSTYETADVNIYDKGGKNTSIRVLCSFLASDNPDFMYLQHMSHTDCDMY